MALWSTVNVSRLGHAFRIEAEYYKPDYLRVAEALDAAKAVSLTRAIEYLTDGTHVTPRYVAKGVPFLSSSDIDEFVTSAEISKFISLAEHARLRHCQPQAGDLLISKSGRIGSCAVVPDWIKRGDWNIYEGVALLRSKDVDPHYLVAFLNCYYGRMQIRRELKGVAQPHLHLEDIRRLRVYEPKLEQSEAIAALVRDGMAREALSHTTFGEAQEALWSALRLKGLVLSKATSAIASLSSIRNARRFDAQHFQVRYAQLLTHLSAFPTAQIREIKTYNRRGVQPVYVTDGDTPVVNSQHIGPKHLDYDGFERTLARYLTASPEARVIEDDVLIYSTGAYVGRANVYLSAEPALASNHVNILRVREDIDRAYLSLVLQSIVGQLQAQQRVRGSTQVELYPADIDLFVVPLLPTKQQRHIGDRVRASLVHHREAQGLFASAKDTAARLIEEAIK